MIRETRFASSPAAVIEKSNRRPSSVLSKPKYRIFCLVSFISLDHYTEFMVSNTGNADISRAWSYHNSTNHSEWSVRSNPHYLDWANQPIPLKIYTTVAPIPLPRDAQQTGISALSAISATDSTVTGERIPNLEDLARILYFSAGITKKKIYSAGEMYFRAAP